MAKRVPVTKEVVQFIKDNEPECSSALLRQFMHEKYDQDMTYSRFLYYITKLINKGVVTKNGTGRHYFLVKEKS